MKSVFTTILLVSFLCMSTYAQQQTNQEFATKPKSKLETTGIILLSTGIVTLASGIALGIKTGGFRYSYENTNGVETETGKPINGVAGVLTEVGGIATVCGTVLTIVGHNISKRHKRISVNVIPNGFYLCYKF